MTVNHREAVWDEGGFHPGYGKGVCEFDGQPWPCSYHRAARNPHVEPEVCCPHLCGRTDEVETVEGRTLLFRCDREWNHDGRHHAQNVEGIEIFWERAKLP